jgi:hypothetical protein
LILISKQTKEYSREEVEINKYNIIHSGNIIEKPIDPIK